MSISVLTRIIVELICKKILISLSILNHQNYLRREIMRKSILSKLLIICSLAVLIFHSCKDDSPAPAIPAVPDQSFVEEFDTASAALARGWQIINTSDPLGGGIWEDGGRAQPYFKAYSNKGRLAGFIGVDVTSTSADVGTISNWLISPSVIMQNGDKIIFYTRAYQFFDGVSDTSDFGNCLEVRINPLNDVVNVGIGFSNFIQGLLVINPNLVYSSVVRPNADSYPTQWTRFEATVVGVDRSVRGRFAFRYFVKDGGRGSSGNGSAIGIDSVAYKSIGH